ncbi:hypothetical protein Afil01_09720 [Actinorhabdospora filicis]|uniref:Transcriptional regulator n=1 Tax=Actinorhabdospora filicis TaxID=1785913 RepID=A0A9W6SFE9_9ACTN|nr:hypothetical protein [Actinorhabdospora filicis]GLZ76165.1 hypothetical protein Afil01_09720 [Actinorhabdospora filicis]
MLRIHFTGEDLARTRLASSADPLWELVLAVDMLRGQRGDLFFTDWRRRTAEALRRGPMARELRLWLVLTPTMGCFPDFLTPGESLRGFEHGIEAVRSTPVSVLARDLRRLDAPRAAHPLLRRLSEGDAGLLAALGDGMRAFHEAAIVPYGPGMAAAVERDRAARVAAMTGGGVEELLPKATWSDAGCCWCPRTSASCTP